MRAAHIKIINLRAFESFESDLPLIAIVSGDHGAGKSSIEEIIKYALGRRPLADKGSRGVEHDPCMLRIGTEKGMAEIRFDDGSEVESLRVVVAPDSTTRQIKTRGSKRWVAAASEIDSFAEALSYDPMVIKNLTPRERVAALLRIMPIEVTLKEISDAAGISVVGTPSLDTISRAYVMIEEERRDINRDIKSLTSHAEELESALPPESQDGDWTKIAAALRADLKSLDSSEAEELKRIGTELQIKRENASLSRQEADSAAEDEHAKNVTAIEDQIATLRGLISDLNVELEKGKSANASHASKLIQTFTDLANDKANEVKAANTPKRTLLTTEIATAEERVRSSAQAEGARESARRARDTVKEKTGKSVTMTASLERLIELRKTVAARMKIPGITIESPAPGLDIDICRIESGKLVPFSIWNDSDKDLLCLKVAVLSHGSFGIVCVDDISGYTPQRRENVIKAARKYAKDSGMQFLFGEAVQGAPLSIKDAEEVTA